MYYKKLWLIFLCISMNVAVVAMEKQKKKHIEAENLFPKFASSVGALFVQLLVDSGSSAATLEKQSSCIKIVYQTMMKDLKEYLRQEEIECSGAGSVDASSQKASSNHVGDNSDQKFRGAVADILRDSEEKIKEIVAATLLSQDQNFLWITLCEKIRTYMMKEKHVREVQSTIVENGEDQNCDDPLLANGDEVEDLSNKKRKRLNVGNGLTLEQRSCTTIVSNFSSEFDTKKFQQSYAYQIVCPMRQCDVTAKSCRGLGIHFSKKHKEILDAIKEEACFNKKGGGTVFFETLADVVDTGLEKKARI